MTVDVFVLHGIAKTIGNDYFDEFLNGIRKHLPLGGDIQFYPVDYSHLLQKKEDTIFQWMKDLPYPQITEFAAFYVADALAYAYPKHHPPVDGDFICDVHKLLTGEFMKGREESKKVIIGHSLGSIVGYGFSWDVKLDCLITMGSPFFYFSPRYKDLGGMNPNLPQFHNFWKGHDKVSCGPISKHPAFAAVKDYEVKSFNPKYLLPIKAHSIYWQSAFVHEKVSEILKKLS